MTFDLHYSNDRKAEAYKMWVRRVYYVASVLELSYSELWDLPEQEFLVLEGLAAEVLAARKKRKEEAELNNGG